MSYKSFAYVYVFIFSSLWIVSVNHTASCDCYDNQIARLCEVKEWDIKLYFVFWTGKRKTTPVDPHHSACFLLITWHKRKKQMSVRADASPQQSTAQS